MTEHKLDTACFHLFVNYDELDSAIRRELDSLREEIRYALISKKDLRNSIEQSFSKIFKLRILAFKSLEQEDEEYEELYDEAYEYFQGLQADSRFQLLSENILFALRSNMRFLKAFLNKVSIEKLEDGINSLPDNITYEALLVTIRLSSPSPDIFKVLKDWTDSTLTIEYIVLACALIDKEKIDVRPSTFEELAAIIAAASHLYNAMAFASGLLNTTGGAANTRNEMNFNQETIEEDQRIAGADLKSFADLWRDDD